MKIVEDQEFYPTRPIAGVMYYVGDKVWLKTKTKKIKARVAAFDLPDNYSYWAVPIVLEGSGLVNIANKDQIARRK